MTAVTAAELAGSVHAAKSAGITAEALLQALERHYRKPGEVRSGEILLPEVQAPGSTRRADLVRIGMWQSRGAGIDVHEIKISRSDWLRELDSPAKAEAWWPYCNRLWVAAVPGVVDDVGELPSGWGLMELPAAGRRFKIRVKAQTRNDVRLTVPLMPELLRRADNLRVGEMAALSARHLEDTRKLTEQWRSRKAEITLPAAVRRRLAVLDKIEAALGVPLDEHAGYPRSPVRDVSPAEMAAFLADALDHVALQRRAAHAAQLEGRLRDAAADVLRLLDGTAK